MSARLIQVIETDTSRGKGTMDNPVRRVMQYWSTDGELLAERDALVEEERASREREERMRGMLDGRVG